MRHHDLTTDLWCPDCRSDQPIEEDRYEGRTHVVILACGHAITEETR